MLDAAFSGVYPASVDDKGRIHVPAAINREIGDEAELRMAVMDGGGADAVMVYTDNSYKAMMADLLQRSKADPELRKRVRAMSYEFFAASIKSGKLLIPKEVRERFALNKNVQVVGVVDHFEIWDEAAWTRLNGEKGGRLGRGDLDALGII